MILIRRRGVAWYEGTFVPRISPFTLYGLIYTIVLLFALQGNAITGAPLDVVRIAFPLLAYFVIMWITGFVTGRLLRMAYPQTATLAFTVASNDFELAIAVSVGVFGAVSGEALAGTVGPLVEVPVLLGVLPRDVVQDRDGRPSTMGHVRTMVVVVVQPPLELSGA